MITATQKFMTAVVARHLSPEARRRKVADFARGALAEAQRVNRSALGRVPEHTTRVDGRLNAPLESVRPHGGRIEFRFDILADLLRSIHTTLRERSPVHSGEYRNAHQLLADGQDVPSLDRIPAATQYVFVNPQPYARRIEVGVTESGRRFTLHVENRIYQRTARDAAKALRGVAHVGFEFIGLAAGAFTRERSRDRSEIRYPAIVITPQGN